MTRDSSGETTSTGTSLSSALLTPRCTGFAFSYREGAPLRNPGSRLINHLRGVRHRHCLANGRHDTLTCHQTVSTLQTCPEGIAQISRTRTVGTVKSGVSVVVKRCLQRKTVYRIRGIRTSTSAGVLKRLAQICNVNPGITTGLMRRNVTSVRRLGRTFDTKRIGLAASRTIKLECLRSLRRACR